jgi:hypothetical protein
MRLVLPLAALVLLTAPAYAQTKPPMPAVTPAAPAAVSPVMPAAVSTAASPVAPPTPSTTGAQAPHHRATMDQRFTKANTTHDGHLTLVQAKAGYPTVVRHFTDIDVTKKGYITEADIRAWDKAERERHHAAKPTTTAPIKG